MNRLKIAFPYLLFLSMAGLVVWSNLQGGVSETSPVENASSQVEALNPNICPTCKMNVAGDAGVAAEVEGNTQRFCWEGCRDRFLASLAGDETPTHESRLIDPVCKMDVNAAWGISHTHLGTQYFFCTDQCQETFVAKPEKYIRDRCMVCDDPLEPASAFPATYVGKTYYLCSPEHRTEFKSDPAAFFMHRMWGIPDWLYYCSIAMVLLVSFFMFEGLAAFGVGTTKRGAAAGGKSPPAGVREETPSHSSGEETRVSTHPRMAGYVAIALPDFSTDLATDRIDLLQWRGVRAALLSRPFRFFAQLVMVVLFLTVIAAGLFGNQNPALNIAPLLTWTIWWCGLVILIMFTGKAWCYLCPWDAIAGWMERLRFWKKTDEGCGLGLRWPKIFRNVFLATLLFVGLTWVELGFGVTMSPRITAYLALAMLAMAIVSAFLFDRKSFCRYGCLVGRVSGLYALFSGIEIRAKESGVCQSCKTKECVKGSGEAYGCPTFEYPGAMTSNTYCIQCAECLQACPEDNLAVNLRPWGADLAHIEKPRTDEAYLALLMLSISGFHGMTMTPVWKQVTDSIESVLSLERIASFSLGMAGLMGFPILIYAVLVWVSHRIATKSEGVGASGTLSYREYFIRYAYCVLPIALFYHLAHNLEHLLMEGPKVIALASDPFGWGWNVLGTAGWTLPPLVSLEILWLLQVLLVGVGHVYSLWAAQRISRGVFPDASAAARSQWPMLAGMIAFSVFSLWLLKQPMEMRTSAM